MSVIVWDGVTLASDSDMNDGQVKVPFEKIWREGQRLCGVVGPVSDCLKLRAWVKEGSIPDKYPTISPDAYLVIVYPNGELTRFTASGIPIATFHKRLALGTGRDFAYGAMFMGASAEDAVRAAIKYSASCSGEVRTLKLRSD